MQRLMRQGPRRSGSCLYFAYIGHPNYTSSLLRPSDLLRAQASYRPASTSPRAVTSQPTPTNVSQTTKAAGETVRNRTNDAVASTSAVVAAGTSRLFNLFYGATLLLGLGIVFVYVTDTRASIHRWVVVPSLRKIYPDPERAHEVGNHALKTLWTMGLHPRERGQADETGDLSVEVFGTMLKNPIGTSAGIDKHADIPDPLMAIGPAIVEIGGTTPQPQPGNEKPRVFRISSQNAMINRYGLNSEGADHVAARLKQRVRRFADAMGFGYGAAAERRVLDGEAGVPPGSLTEGKLLAINIAKNKSTPENDIEAVAADYVYCVHRLAPYADILVVNVSSPNTPGLRTLQQGTSLRKILEAVVSAAHAADRKVKPAVMVKVSPDEDSDEQVAGIARAVWESGVDGVIVGNTTNHRPTAPPHLPNLTPIEEQYLLEQGGFSGPHLFERTVALVKKYNKLMSERPAFLPTSSKTSPDANPERVERDAPPSTTRGGERSTSIEAARASVTSGVVPAHDISDISSGEKKPLINLPTSKFYSQTTEEQNRIDTSPPVQTDRDALSESRQDSSEPEPEPARVPDRPKVIFATGGIANGKQALQVLNAGASVAMVYTALVYGGAGTISRIKDEMRSEMRSQRKATDSTT